MKANYGIDAPSVVLYLTVAGLGFVAIGFVPGMPNPGPLILDCIGGAWLLTAIIMVLASRVFKLLLRDKIVKSLQLTGSEHVLDIGCGRGLMLIGMAKKLPNGKAFGADIWRKADQSGNGPDAVMKNAKAEGVADRIQVETADMRKMPFEHQAFDCVVSSWAIHNLREKDDRYVALLEALRVLKPGGKLVIADIFTFDEYVVLLNGLRMENVTLSKPNFMFFVPTKIVSATKPAR